MKYHPSSNLSLDHGFQSGMAFPQHGHRSVSTGFTWNMTKDQFCLMLVGEQAIFVLGIMAQEDSQIDRSTGQIANYS